MLTLIQRPKTTGVITLSHVVAHGAPKTTPIVVPRKDDRPLRDAVLAKHLTR